MGLALVLDQECARILPSTLLLGGLLLHSSQPHLFVGPRFLKRPSFLCEPQLEDQFLEVKRKRFLESAPIDDVRRQLHGLPSTVPVPSPDQRNTFRSRLATGLFTSQAPVVGSDEDVSRRIAALKGFNAHCFRQEPKAPHKTEVKLPKAKLPNPRSVMYSLLILSGPNLTHPSLTTQIPRLPSQRVDAFPWFFLP